MTSSDYHRELAADLARRRLAINVALGLSDYLVNIW
jgi:hypothetical protein